MATIKAGLSDPDKVFNYDGIDYPKGSWDIFYQDIEVDLNGDVNLDVLKIGIKKLHDPTFILQQALPFSQYRDGTNTAYASLNDLVTALAEFLDFNTASGGSGAFVPTQQHTFDSITARDAYFTANPGDLRRGLPIFVTITGNVVLQLWSGDRQSTYDATPPVNDDDKWANAGTFSGTGAQIKVLYEGEPNTNAYTDAEKTKLAGIESGAQVNVDTNLSFTTTATTLSILSSTGADITLPSATTTQAGIFVGADKTKLDGVETGATADQTGAEIKVAYEGELNTNAYTDADQTAVSTSFQNAAPNGNNTIRFTRQNATVLDVTIVTAGRPLTPNVAGGASVVLRPEAEDWDASVGTFPTGASAGFAYIVSVGGKVDGIDFNPDDLLIALVDSASTTVYANNWQKVEGGVHSWGGLTGIITDAQITGKLTRLGYVVNNVVPSIHNFSINIPSRVDLNTDLNVQRTVTYSVTNRSAIQSIRLIVTVGDDKNLTVPLADGLHTEDVILSGISTAVQGSVSFFIRITDTDGTEIDSNTYTVNIQNLSVDEFAYYGVRTTDDFSTVDLSLLTSVNVSNSGSAYTINLQGANQSILGILSPDNRDPASIVDPLGQPSLSDFTPTTNVRTENGRSYNLLTLTNNSGFEGNFNYAIITE